MSTPTSRIASIDGRIDLDPPGSLPAERTWMRPCERSLTSPAAIWLRPALWTQTKSTSGCSFSIAPLRLGERLQPLAREPVHEQRDVGR